MSFPFVRSGPHPVHSSLSPSDSVPKRHFDLFSRFCRITAVTNTQTDHAMPSVAIARVFTMHAMRAKRFLAIDFSRQLQRSTKKYDVSIHYSIAWTHHNIKVFGCEKSAKAYVELHRNSLARFVLGQRVVTLFPVVWARVINGDRALHNNSVIISSKIKDMIRYDTICYFNVRSKANMSQLNLPHVYCILHFYSVSLKTIILLQ